MGVVQVSSGLQQRRHEPGVWKGGWRGLGGAPQKGWGLGQYFFVDWGHYLDISRLIMSILNESGGRGGGLAYAITPRWPLGRRAQMWETLCVPSTQLSWYHAVPEHTHDRAGTVCSTVLPGSFLAYRYGHPPLGRTTPILRQVPHIGA